MKFEPLLMKFPIERSQPAYRPRVALTYLSPRFLSFEVDTFFPSPMSLFACV